VVVREDGDTLVLVRQSDHAMLSGWLAAAWGATPWEAPQPYDSTVVAARLHDLAWTSFDESLPRRPDGRPYAFNEVERAISTRLYIGGVDAVEAIDGYAGLICSLHFSGFLTSHWGWQPLGRPSQLEGEEKQVVDAFLAHELDRQRRLRDRLGVDRAQDRQLMCDYFWLQLWDRISLDICRYGFNGHAVDYPAVPLGAQPGAPEARLHLELQPGGTCRLDPYPLLGDPFRTRVPAVRVPLDVVRDTAKLRPVWAAGGGETIDVTFRPLRDRLCAR
jgi:uncharacterized protein DUF3891